MQKGKGAGMIVPVREARCRRRWPAWVAVMAFLTAVGCGGDGPRRYHISGKVTYKGHSIPAGEIIFDPDVTKGKDGVQGFALIRDGEYDTSVRGGKGVGAGPYVVKIRGYDGKPRGELPLGEPLFPEYEDKIDLPGER